MDRKLRRQLGRNPELRAILVARPEYTVELTGGGHLKISHPSGAFFYTGTTPSDSKAIRQVERQMRRIERGAS